MLLSNGGKTITLRIPEKEPMPGMGIKPGVFPDEIIVKQRNHYLDGKDSPTETAIYVRKETA